MAFYKSGHETCRRELEDIRRGDTEYTLVRRHSKDFSDFLTFCKDQPDLCAYFESRKEARSSRREENDDEDSWAGTPNYAKCQELAENGWSEGLKYVEDVREKMSRIVASKIKAFHPRLADAGDEIDIGAFVEGDPEHWIEFHEIDTDGPGGKIVRVLVNVAVSCSVDKKYFIHRGAAVVGLMEALQNCGYSVELTLLSTTEHENHIHQYEIPVKRPDEHLDGDRCSFMVIHPSILRRLVFSAKEQEETDDYTNGYGIPTEIVGATDKDFVFDRMHADDDFKPFRTVESSADYMLKMLVDRGLVSVEE
tara:strand:- start:38014 stop:38937 length:924 start_codon:yes stop_codon:yes gene_type:complete